MEAGERFSETGEGHTTPGGALEEGAGQHTQDSDWAFYNIPRKPERIVRDLPSWRDNAAVSLRLAVPPTAAGSLSGEQLSRGQSGARQ